MAKHLPKLVHSKNIDLSSKEFLTRLDRLPKDRACAVASILWWQHEVQALEPYTHHRETVSLEQLADDLINLGFTTDSVIERIDQFRMSEKRRFHRTKPRTKFRRTRWEIENEPHYYSPTPIEPYRLGVK